MVHGLPCHLEHKSFEEVAPRKEFPHHFSTITLLRRFKLTVPSAFFVDEIEGT